MRHWSCLRVHLLRAVFFYGARGIGLGDGPWDLHCAHWGTTAKRPHEMVWWPA